jgi:Tol biopolymer transport system component
VTLQGRSRIVIGAVATALIAVPAIGGPAPSAAAETGTTQRASVGMGGANPDNGSYAPAVTPDGRYVAFTSDAENLVAGDDNGLSDVFVLDRQTGSLQRVSVDSSEQQADDASYAPTISDNGCRVAFLSDSDFLSDDDFNGGTDAFVRDRCAGTTTLVSVWTDETPSEIGISTDDAPSISADGTRVLFTGPDGRDQLWAAADLNEDDDVFYRNLTAGTTERVSRSPMPSGANSGRISADGKFAVLVSFGGPVALVYIRNLDSGASQKVSIKFGTTNGNPNGPAIQPSVSSNGQFVAFASTATNLTSGGVDGGVDYDVFVRDRFNGTTTRASLDFSGGDTNAASDTPMITGDGTRVAFRSLASDVTRADGNDQPDVFVRNLAAGSNQRVSVDPLGLDADGPSTEAMLDATGTIAVFESFATDLVADDTNAATDVFVRDLVDTEPPTLALNGPTSRWSLQRVVSAPYTSSDPAVVAGVHTQLQPTKWNGAPGDWLAHRSNLPANGTASYWGTYGRTYCFRAQAVDEPGNISPWSAKRCTAIPLYSGNLTYSGTWTTYNPADAFAKTARYTTQKGARMTRSGIVGERLSLIVTRCSTCGTVAVKLNGVTMKTYSLFAPTTQRKQVLEFAARATPYTGTVTVEVTSSGKLVVIEGLGVYQD